MTTPKKTKLAKGETSTISFEASYAELEKIVDAFDHGDLTLDQAVTSFERGIELAEQLKKRLTAVENRVKSMKAQMIAKGTDEGEEWTSSDS